MWKTSEGCIVYIIYRREGGLSALCSFLSNLTLPTQWNLPQHSSSGNMVWWMFVCWFVCATNVWTALQEQTWQTNKRISVSGHQRSLIYKLFMRVLESEYETGKQDENESRGLGAGGWVVGWINTHLPICYGKTQRMGWIEI